MMKKFLPYLLLLIVSFLMPTLALADPAFGTLKPNGDDLWTLRVFGNGEAIRNILEAIKLLMVPEGGNTGFNTLMTLLATLGFLVLAVQAGFDPAKNLMKMFSFILVIATVHILTINVRANISIVDQVSGQKPLVVQDVPALVGVPAALVSQVGHWFTKSIETNYTIPSALTTTGGTFNLFGRMMQESNEYVITNAELKKSLSAYVADCAVPAMARGQLAAADLMTSTNMTETLGRATHKAILTKYWPNGTPNSSGTGVTYPKTIEHGGVSYQVQGGMGAVLPCEAAWASVNRDLESHAQELLNGSARAWSKTGVMVPFEQAMSTSLAQVASGGANGSANYSKPQGYILQQAMLNSMNGSFRSAAASIGNNDLLMAASIAQAEQSQKSSWFTAGKVFTNMMGYVYTTLQAFIFAIVPIVVVSLMIPGLGKSILTNYAQILVWLTLWQPMLSIVNFLITLFGKETIGSSFEMAAGITMQNKWVVTEQTNDLMLAAQFLGTSVPLLTWGLVKGSLAFTEFISNGIGSSMAQQAGATAATGNMSMNNMSMDNASMNKFNTAHSSAVGAQSTMGYTGGMQSAFDSGGHSMAQNGTAQSRSISKAVSVASQASLNDSANYQEQASNSLQAAHALSKDGKYSQNSSEVKALTASALTSLTASHASALASKNGKAVDETLSSGREAANAALTQLEASARVGASLSAESDKQLLGAVASFLTGVKASAKGEVGGGASAQANSSLAERVARLQAYKESGDWSDSNSRGNAGQHQDARGQTNTSQAGTSSDRSMSVADQASISEALQKSASKAHGASTSLAASASVGDQISHGARLSDMDVGVLDNLGSGPGSVRNQADVLTSQVQGEVGAPLNNMGGPGNTNPSSAFDAMSQAAKDAHKNSPAQEAEAAVANHAPRGAPSAPAAPNGRDVAGDYKAGDEKAEAATLAAKHTPREGGDLSPAQAKAAQEAAIVKREDTGAMAYAAERGMSKVANVAGAVESGTSSLK